MSTFAITRHMEAGGRDYRQRLTLTFVPVKERRYKEIYCLSCARKLIETYDDVAYVSDIDDMTTSIMAGKPSTIGFRCPGGCKTWYEFKSLPGVFEIEMTRIFFLGTEQKYREVHCLLCKELFCTVTTGSVFGLKDPHTALKQDSGFVPTFCPNCVQEYEIATNLA